MLLPFLYGVLCGNRLTWLHAVGIAMMTAALTLTVLPARGQAERPTKGFVILCCLIFVINDRIRPFARRQNGRLLLGERCQTTHAAQTP